MSKIQLWVILNYWRSQTKRFLWNEKIFIHCQDILFLSFQIIRIWPQGSPQRRGMGIVLPTVSQILDCPSTSSTPLNLKKNNRKLCLLSSQTIGQGLLFTSSNVLHHHRDTIGNPGPGLFIFKCDFLKKSHFFYFLLGYLCWKHQNGLKYWRI